MVRGKHSIHGLTNELVVRFYDGVTRDEVQSIASRLTRFLNIEYNYSKLCKKIDRRVIQPEGPTPLQLELHLSYPIFKVAFIRRYEGYDNIMKTVIIIQ